MSTPTHTDIDLPREPLMLCTTTPPRRRRAYLPSRHPVPTGSRLP
jgi:hypothetical protein